MKKLAQKIPLCLLLALLALCFLWEAWLAPLRGAGTVSLLLLVVKIVPLALALRGFAQDRLYTYKWMSLAVWLYFTEGVVRGWGNGTSSSGLGNQLAWAEAALAVLLFAAVVLRIRQIRLIRL